MPGVRTIATLAILICLVAPSFPLAAADHQYDQDVLLNWPKLDLDVLVASAGDPFIGAAILRAIEMWENGIAALGGPDVRLRVYWIDSGTAPPPDFKTDILFVPQGFGALNLNFPGNLDFLNSLRNSLGAPRCTAMAPLLTDLGNFIRLTSHEFGHCLGLAHVFEHGVEYAPGFDIMGSGIGARCPSNLNVEVLHRVFSGQGGTVSISSSSYFQASSC